MLEDIFGIKIFWMNNKLSFLYVMPKKNLFVVFLFKHMQFLKFNSPINLSFFGYSHNKLSLYIKDFNCPWSTKSSHSRTAIFIFLFIHSKRISSLVLVISVGASCCFNDNVHPFTYLFITSTRLFLLHLRVPIYSNSILIPFIFSFTVSTRIFMLHFSILTSSTSLLFPFTSSFVISTFFSYT